MNPKLILNRVADLFIFGVMVLASQAHADDLKLIGKVDNYQGGIQALISRLGDVLGEISSDGNISINIASNSKLYPSSDSLRGDITTSGRECDEKYVQSKNDVSLTYISDFTVRKQNIITGLLVMGTSDKTWYGSLGSFINYVYASDDVTILAGDGCKDRYGNFNTRIAALDLKKGWNAVSYLFIVREHKEMNIWDFVYKVVPINTPVKWNIVSR